MRSLWVAAGVCFLAVLSGGCGDDSTGTQGIDPSPSAVASSDAASGSATPTSTPSSTAPSTPDWPECDEVWVDGQKLPGVYRGCLRDGQPVKAQKQFCEFGKPLVTFANKFWAVPDGPVHEVATTLAKDPGWHKALRQCGG
jgi:hypothetical protein